MTQTTDAPIKDVIQLPVRYDDRKLAVIGSDGEELAHLDLWLDETDSDGTRMGDYIAKVLNEYPALVQRLSQAEKVIEHYADESNWYPHPDESPSRERCIYLTGSGPDKARAYLSEGQKK